MNPIAKNKMAHIATIVSDYFEVEYYKLFTKSRKEEYVLARQMTMYISRNTLNYSHKEAAGFFNRDHATSVHAIKAIDNLLETSKESRQQFAEIRLKLIR